MKILLVEDMATQRIILGLSLKRLGYEYVTAADGKEAWEIYQKQHFPVVLTDWQMPNLDGLGLCRLIREHPHEQYTYVIVLTASGGKVDYLEAIEAGTDDFLVKPCEDDLLKARLLVARRVGGLLTEAKQLQECFSICPNCKKINADGDRWLKVEQYLASLSKGNVLAGVCPECRAAQQQTERRMWRDLRPTK